MGREQTKRRALGAGAAAALLTFVGLSGQADAATGPERPTSDPVFATRTSTFAQRNVDAVRTPSGWFAVWAENRGGGNDIFGGHVGAGGQLPDGGGITISPGVDNGLNPGLSAVNPAVAVDDDGQYLVTWTDDDLGGDTDVYAARVGAAGQVLDPAALTIDDDADIDGGPDVVWTGRAFVVVYQAPASTAAVRVSSAGQVTPLGTVATGVVNADVARSGSTELLVGQRGTNRITGLRLDDGGAPLGTVFEITGTSVPGRQIQPTVAATPSGWLAAWTDERNGSTGVGDVYAARVASDGTVLDPDGFPVPEAVGNQDGPRAGDGNPVLVTWRDDRDGEGDLFGAHVSSAGTVAEPGGTPISTTAGGESAQAVVPGAGTDAAAFYTRTAPEAPYGGANHGFFRTVSSPK